MFLARCLANKLKRNKLILATVIIATITSGCASVTATSSGQADFQYQPNYDERRHFFFWGLIGSPTVNVKEVCVDRPARQMQTIFTATDALFATLTGGLWLPRTARVWCARDEEIF